MTRDRSTLRVPTTLARGETDRAEEICVTFLHYHFAADATGLGYEAVDVLDTTGRHLVACTN